MDELKPNYGHIGHDVEHKHGQVGADLVIGMQNVAHPANDNYE